MKREGRQHGHVVSYYHTPTSSLSRKRFVKMVDSASSMGLFAKVPTKPTNHSKFTGKCRKPRCNDCHLHPVCKSRAKVKGAMKLRSIDPENELTKYCFGASATGVLDNLADGGGGGDYDNDDYDYEDRLEEYSNYNYNYGYDYDYDYEYDDNNSSLDIDHDEDDVDVGKTDDDDDDEVMSFCDVGLCWGDGDDENDDDDDDDGWYLVGGKMLN
ncbi:hypothetical protein SSX86_014669 [Deinandra increscens subsp. villosa]|uniref:Uncharacterized protein n=1 Tax=Deinandra increscens subsp. villosa TaxID=3103831 RepID=A0AAP0D9X7_9ASTR